MFATLERVVMHEDVQSMPEAACWPRSVEIRRLPLTVLGQGHSSVADKMRAHVQQVWLDYGPEDESVRAANRMVRQCLSDMGTKFGIGDSRDLLGQCLLDRASSAVDSHVYPLALVAPGP